MSSTGAAGGGGGGGSTGTAGGGGTGGGSACAACADAASCPQPSGDCLARTCSGGCCGVAPESEGVPCTSSGGRICNGAGACVACLGTSDCPPSGTVCATVSCSGSECLALPAVAGAPCAEGGGSFCDGEGHCVAPFPLGTWCASAAVCASGFCVDGVCCDTPCTAGCKACDGSGHCGNGPDGPASPAHPCPVGDTCCSGACTDTTTDVSQCGACGHACPAGTACSTPICAGTCGTVAAPAGTACGAGSGAQCDGQGECWPCAGVVDLRAGNEGACAIRSDATLWCWGAGPAGVSTTPSEIGGGFASVKLWDTGEVGIPACGVKVDGTLWCWGSNPPAPVTTLGNGVADVSLNLFDTCAVKKDGTAWCWGDNLFGQVGDGTTTHRDVPVPVTTLGNDVVRIALGDENACAIKGDGTLWCWGGNVVGLLGDGTTTDRFSPVPVTALGNAVVDVVLTHWVSCAIKADGTLWCWGDNGTWQVGAGTSQGYPLPQQTLDSVTQIAAAFDHSCAVRTDATLWCWGQNDVGQLGDGTLTARATPVQVLDGVASVGTGSGTCALRTDGSVWCWGKNDDGQVGDGTTVDRLTPTPVSILGTAVTSLSMGAAGACVTVTGGAVYCWGANGAGEVGTGSGLAYSPTPARLPFSVCPVDACADGRLDGTETGVDCGGSCLAFGLTCPLGSGCESSADCDFSGYCAAGTCHSTCTDGVKDRAETDLDCGGPFCPTCGVGEACTFSRDCGTGLCVEGVCSTCQIAGGDCDDEIPCCTGLTCSPPACSGCFRWCM